MMQANNELCIIEYSRRTPTCMANQLVKEKAQNLRRQGLSIRDITTKLQANKSTISYWCRDIKLSQGQIFKLKYNQKISTTRALLQIAENKRQKRISETEHLNDIGKNDVGNLDKRDLFIAGLALYWGEGYKKGNEEVGFTNNDPKAIKLMLHWFKRIYKIKDTDFVLRLSINEIHKSRLNKILKFWTTYTNIPLSQFTKTSFTKNIVKKRYSNHDSFHGTLRLKVRRSTKLHRRIMGSISALQK